MKNIIVIKILLFIVISCQSLDYSFLRESRSFSNISSVFFVEPRLEHIKSESAEDKIVSYIYSAKKSIQMALYTIDSHAIIEALLFAHRKNIDVKIVVDAEEYFTFGVLSLREHGIAVIPVNYDGIMHHKFIILDEEFILTGTGNFTISGLFYNDNHFIIINNKYIVGKFIVEFRQLFFGLKILDNLELSSLEINALGEIQVLFSPNEGDLIVQKIKNLILKSKNSIHYMIFSFTDREIAQALLDANSRGVQVYGIHDATLSGSLYDAGKFLLRDFRVSGIKDNNSFIIQKDGNRHTKYENGYYSGGKMHCKTIIIDMYSDNPIIITGSFNWSKNAKKKNNENIVIIYNNSDVVNVIFEQWHDSWSIAQEY